MKPCLSKDSRNKTGSGRGRRLIGLKWIQVAILVRAQSQ